MECLLKDLAGLFLRLDLRLRVRVWRVRSIASRLAVTTGPSSPKAPSSARLKRASPLVNAALGVAFWAWPGQAAATSATAARQATTRHLIMRRRSVYDVDGVCRYAEKRPSYVEIVSPDR